MKNNKKIVQGYSLTRKVIDCLNSEAQEQGLSASAMLNMILTQRYKDGKS